MSLDIFSLLDPAQLTITEAFWRDHYYFLKDRGYTLRRRYEPDWTPSWADGSKDSVDCEDSIRPRNSVVMDASRRDGTFVAIKRVAMPHFAEEIAIGKLFTSPELATSPKNHCVPFLDIIEPKEGSHYAFIVMPLLLDFCTTPFETIGEAVEFFRHIFEGLEFMHSHNISHGDCKSDNIMADIDVLYDHPPHPQSSMSRRGPHGGRVPIPSSSRTQIPIKYYLIDFNLSRVFGKDDSRLVKPPWGGDRTVPEHLLLDAPACDPFPVDVYCLGNVVKQRFLDGYPEISLKPVQGFEFMRELVMDMTHSDPKQRPTMDIVVARYSEIVKGLDEWTLRSPVIKAGASIGLFRYLSHWTRQLFRAMWGIPAIPRA